MECNFCDGTGLEPTHSMSICPTCWGDKKLTSMQRFTKTIMTCFTCNGEGKVIMPEDCCSVCLGKKVVAPLEQPLLIEEAVAPTTASSKFVEKVKNIKVPKMPKIKNPFKKKNES